MPVSPALPLLACCVLAVVGQHLLGALRRRRLDRQGAAVSMSPAEQERVFWADTALHFAGGLCLGGGIGGTIVAAALYAFSR